jgi:transcriptional regulator with XRE-family HTH domain
MTVRIKDLPEGQDDTIATRIRAARERAGLTRADLSSRTGIPTKSIEKFEYGHSEPPVSRLDTIARETGVSLHWLISGDDGAEAVPAKPGTTAPGGAPSWPNPNDALAPVPTEQARAELAVLDAMRASGFDKSPRKALASIDRLRGTLRFLEPDELMALGFERGLFMGECPTGGGLFDLFNADPDNANAECGNLEERIIDTAVFGLDLFAIERDPLTDLADELREAHDSIEGPGFLSGWGSHSKFVPLIRPVLRNMAVAGKAPALADASSFPKRA